MMVANEPEQPLESEVGALGDSPRVVVVELPWRAVRVHEALSRLQGEAVSWTGPQREIARVATYRSAHTVSDALTDLEEAGLLLRQAQGNGRMLTYYLRTATPSGEAFVIRTAPASQLTGRDVIRAAGQRVDPLPPASATYAATSAMTYAAPPPEPMQSPSDFDEPSMSSDRRRRPALLHDAAEVAWTTAEVAAAGRLVSLQIEPEADIVQALAVLTGAAEADTWRRLQLRRTSSPEFVRACLESTYRLFPSSAPGAAGHAQTTASRQGQGKTSTSSRAGVRRVSWGELAASAAAAVTTLVWGERGSGERT